MRYIAQLIVSCPVPSALTCSPARTLLLAAASSCSSLTVGGCQACSWNSRSRRSASHTWAAWLGRPHAQPPCLSKTKQDPGRSKPNRKHLLSFLADGIWDNGIVYHYTLEPRSSFFCRINIVLRDMERLG